jgi:hypothetical protein
MLAFTLTVRVVTLLTSSTPSNTYQSRFYINTPRLFQNPILRSATLTESCQIGWIIRTLFIHLTFIRWSTMTTNSSAWEMTLKMKANGLFRTLKIRRTLFPHQSLHPHPLRLRISDRLDFRLLRMLCSSTPCSRCSTDCSTGPLYFTFDQVDQ